MNKLPEEIEKKPFEKLKFRDERLKTYAQTFYDFFSQRWDKKGFYFSVKIYWHKNVVGMNFEVSEEEPKEKISFEKIEGKNFLEEIKTKIKVGEFHEQEDIKGFNENSFYIVKPNQYENWHKALAELDLNEFYDSILKAGKRHLSSCRRQQNDRR